jgi:hypothetical protein
MMAPIQSRRHSRRDFSVAAPVLVDRKSRRRNFAFKPAKVKEFFLVIVSPQLFYVKNVRVVPEIWIIICENKVTG